MPVLALALGVNSFAAVLRPAGSPFMPLRCPHQAPELRAESGGATAVDRQAIHKNAIVVSSRQKIARHVHKSWQVVYSA
jgi:hypothetical protein